MEVWSRNLIAFGTIWENHFEMFLGIEGYHYVGFRIRSHVIFRENYCAEIGLPGCPGTRYPNGRYCKNNFSQKLNSGDICSFFDVLFVFGTLFMAFGASGAHLKFNGFQGCLRDP